MKNEKFNLKLVSIFLFTLLLILIGQKVTYAHCDSYDGPVIQDAIKALETNKVMFVLKWVQPQYENEITSLFNKTYSLRNGDKEVYEIVEKHFFETLVRLHREGEGAPYTGLKPAGSTTPIVKMADKALNEENIDELLKNLDNHINKVVREKYNKVIELSKVKDVSLENGREYVKHYVDYTHTLEAIHKGIETDHSSHNH